jgi:TonB family protein
LQQRDFSRHIELSANRFAGKMMDTTMKDKYKKINRASFVLLVASFVCCARAEADSVAHEIDVYKAPRILKYNPPPYPRGQLLDNREGWVTVNMMVDPSGKAYEVGVVDSLGGVAFERAAIQAMENSTFTPATNGSAPIHSSLTFTVRFSISDLEKGATREFVNKYKTLLEAITSGNRAVAEVGLVQLKGKNLYEDSYRNVALYQFQRKWGTNPEQLAALRAAVASEKNGEYLPRPMYAAVLESMLGLEVRLNDLGSALDTWQTFRRIASEENKRKWSPVIAQIAALRASTDRVRQDVDISRGTSYFGTLFRNRFEISVLSGNIREIKVRCQGAYLFFEYEASIVYEVSGSPGRCVIEAVGANNTKFSIIYL